MDGAILRQIKEALLSRRERLITERKSEFDGVELDPNQAELVDVAQTIELMDREKSLAAQEQKERMAIEYALSKLSSGSFGICEECEEEIPARRLMVLPQARLCAGCQAYEEKAQGRLARAG